MCLYAPIYDENGSLDTYYDAKKKKITHNDRSGKIKDIKYEFCSFPQQFFLKDIITPHTHTINKF